MNVILQNISHFLWGFPLPFLIASVGLFLSIKSHFFQITNLKKSIFSSFSRNEKKSNGISPFAATCTALSATIGTGNIAGVAGAVSLGGPGALFWIWISAFLGMMLKVAETVLAVKYREKKADGFAGGPMYYISRGLPTTFKPLGVFFAVFACFAALGSGNAVQSNTVTMAIINIIPNSPSNMSDILRIICGLVLAILIGLVLLGGAVRISKTAETLVPAMIILYLVLALGVVFMNIKNLPSALVKIFEGAFNPKAVTGGVIGSFFITFSKGISRGIFTNEAGLGTSAMAHSAADTDSPKKQGLFGIFEVFVDTIVICSITAFAILCADVPIAFGTDMGANLTIQAFASVYGVNARPILAVSICFFAFTSMLGWGLYGMRCIDFLLGSRAIKPFLFVFSACSLFGSFSSPSFVWLISDICNALMAIPNIIAILFLSPVVLREIM